MKKSNAKRKGKLFEEKVAKIIHEFLYENFHEYKDLIDNFDSSIGVKRDKDSGVSIDSKGDIELGIGVKFYPFAIECKKREDLDISIKVISNIRKSKLYTIYKNQAKKKAKEKNLFPLLIFSRNYTKPFVFVDLKDLSEVIRGKIKNIIYRFNHILVDDILIISLDEFNKIILEVM